MIADFLSLQNKNVTKRGRNVRGDSRDHELSLSPADDLERT